MSDDITNKELVEALIPFYGTPPSIGYKLLWVEALRRLRDTPDTVPDAPPVEQTAPPEAVPVARDVPVVLPEQAPDTPRGRADVRMGRNKGRP